MGKSRYKMKAKKVIAGMIAIITLLNSLLGNSAGGIQALAAAENASGETIENQRITITLNGMNAGNYIKEKEVTIGENYGTLPTPVWEGYDFEGWYTEKSEGVRITGETIVQKNVSELFAHWKPIEINVDLYGFGVDALDANSITVTYGHTFAELPTLEQDEYDFEGWFTSPTGGTRVSNQTQVTMTSPIALYARWSGKKVTVSFVAEGALVAPSPLIVESGDVYGSLPIPERKGYDFCGWFLDEEGATEITEDTVVITEETNY